MTRRERMQKAINHTEPDRVPIDNGGVVSGMHEVAYRHLLAYLGIEDTITIYDWVMEDLIDIGVDIVQPLQANAAGNEDPEKLKKDFGDRIVFHGNTNNQGVFHKSKEEIIADALYRIKHLAPGGGYIFSSGHNIQANMAPGNILALFETAREYGSYPIDTERIDEELKRLKAEVSNI